MKVKDHTVLTGLKVDDPAEYARAADLVNNHDAWVFPIIGAWRWVAIDKYRDRIKDLVTKGYTIDYGGAAAPVGYGAVVVDYQMPAPSGPRSLVDVPPAADCIFCSHTLEHFVDADLALAMMYHKLKPGGSLIIQVPSYRKTNLRADVWDYHEHTYKLAWETNQPFTAVDDMVEAHGFQIEVKDLVGDCIIIIAHKP